MNELNVVERLKEIVEMMYGTLKQEDNFTIQTVGANGVVIGTHSNDRESYLQFGLEIAFEQLNEVVEEMEEQQGLEEKESVKAYQEDGCYIYDDKEKPALIEYDLTWKTATAYNDKGDTADLTAFFPFITSLADFELKARNLWKERFYV